MYYFLYKNQNIYLIRCSEVAINDHGNDYSDFQNLI